MANWETRQSIFNANRILDVATRERRLKKALDALEQDNFQDEPYGDEGKTNKGPKLEVEETSGNGVSAKKKRVRPSDYYKNKYIKSFQHLVEEDLILKPENPNYSTVEAPPSILPKRNFCTVCGFPSLYTCTQCNAKFCQTKCLTTHRDTRCLKWTI